jgi:hypothetical protein
MKVGPKINATAFIETPTCIDGTWKIAAVQDMFPRWQWFGDFRGSSEEATRLRDFLHVKAINDRPPTISFVQGKQFVDGFMRLCLYARVYPK